MQPTVQMRSPESSTSSPKTVTMAPILLIILGSANAATLKSTTVLSPQASLMELLRRQVQHRDRLRLLQPIADRSLGSMVRLRRPDKLSPKYPDQPVAFFPANGSFTAITTGNTYMVKPGTTGPNITSDDFFVNGPLSRPITRSTNSWPHGKPFGGIINTNYSPTDWLKFYDRFIIQRNEENTITPNQGFSGFKTASSSLLIILSILSVKT